MKLLLNLLATPDGLLALVVSLVALALAVGFHVFLRSKVRKALSEHDAPGKG